MRKRLAAIFLITTLIFTTGLFEMFAFAEDVELSNSEDEAVLETTDAGDEDVVVDDVVIPDEDVQEETAPEAAEELDIEEGAPEAAIELEGASDETSAETTVTGLDKLTAAVKTDSVTLSWAYKEGEALASGETITIKYAGGESTGITDTSATISGLAPATDYTFIFMVGDKQIGSVEATTLPGVVTGFRKVSSYKTVILKWSKVAGASKYIIKVNGAEKASLAASAVSWKHNVGSEKDIINLYNTGSGAKYSGNLNGKDRYTYTITAVDANGKAIAESTTTGDIVKTLYYKLTFKSGATLTSHSGGKVKIKVKKGAIVYARGFSDGKYIFDYKCKDGKVRTYYTMKIRVKAALSKHITAVKKKRGTNTQPAYTLEEAEQYVNDRGVKKATTNYMIWANLFSQKEYVFQKKAGKWKIVTANSNGLKNKVMSALPVSSGKATMPTATGSTKINRKLKSQHGTPLWNVTKYFSVHGVQKKWPSPGWPESGACVRNQNPNATWIYNKIPKYSRVFVH